MLLGLAYNVIEQDFFGSGIFLVSSIVFLALGILKNVRLQNQTTLHNMLLTSCLSSPLKSAAGTNTHRASPNIVRIFPLAKRYMP